MSAAGVALYGMDGMSFLTTRSNFKRRVMESVATEAAKLRIAEYEGLANMIANEVARRFGGN